MSIYTYIFSQSLCETLGIEFVENPDISDQELNKIPEDAKISGIICPAFPIMYGKDHPHYGKRRPDDVRAKISKSRSGQSLSSWTEDRRRKTVSSLKGRKPSAATMEAAMRAQLGSKRSEETKQKMREAQNKRRLREKGLL
jgi:hypothetical protein